jgi:hypothetical protein
MRARKVVTRSGKRIRGKFPSTKLGRMVHWESLYERDAILHLEYHPLVVSYQEQPSVEIYYDPVGESHKYFPDFSALLSHGKELCFEVKPERFLKKRDVREKLDSVAMRFEELGRHFRVLTEKDIRREPLLTNLKAIHVSAKKVSHRETVLQLANSVAAGPTWSFRDLVMQLGSVQSVLRLIRADHLRADLEAALTYESPVWLASTDGEAHGAFRL